MGLVATAALGLWLGERALTAGSGLTTSPGRAADLADAVAVVLLWIGCVAAAWYALTCALALLIHLGRAAGATTSVLEHAVRCWGFPLLRRAVLTTVAAGAGLSLTVGAAGAAPTDATPALPEDLGWGADVVTEQPTAAGTRLGEAAGSSFASAADAGGDEDAMTPVPRAPGPPGGAGASTIEDQAEGAAPADAATPAPTATATATAADLAAPGTPESASAPVATTAGIPPSPDQHGPPEGSGEHAAGPGDPEYAAGPGDREHAAAPGDRAHAAAPDDSGTYTVRPGDSLWSIAAAHLGEHATTEAVARAWPKWHRANRPQLGANPHLIHPGQLLHVPDEEAS